MSLARYLSLVKIYEESRYYFLNYIFPLFLIVLSYGKNAGGIWSMFVIYTFYVQKRGMQENQGALCSSSIRGNIYCKAIMWNYLFLCKYCNFTFFLQLPAAYVKSPEEGNAEYRDFVLITKSLVIRVNIHLFNNFLGDSDLVLR